MEETVENLLDRMNAKAARAGSRDNLPCFVVFQTSAVNWIVTSFVPI